MNIGITGASGFIGRKIIDLALRRGHDIVAFSRHPERGIPGCTMRHFSIETPPDLSDCEAIIHLAGEPVAGLWTHQKKWRIRESRVAGTRQIVEAIQASAHPPEVLVCGSATGIYGDQGDKEITEHSPHGSGFLSGVVEAWEAEAIRAHACRVVLLRTSIVLGNSGGPLPMMVRPFRAALGGRLGSGRQWMPWIHIEDEAMLALFAMENLDIHGPLNATAPWPIRNVDFTKTLAHTVRRPAIFHVPAAVVRLLGEFSHELLDSKRVVPASATEHGFRFRFPELEGALKDLYP